MSDPRKSSLFRTRSGRDPSREKGAGGRFYDVRYEAMSVMVLPGRHHVSNDPEEMIVTLLGSCIAACIHDPVAKIGGLNHFLLPESETGTWNQVNAVMRFGNHAMEVLINDIIKRGGDRSRFEVKVFGGANVIDSRSATPVGSRNVAFIERYLANEGFDIAAKHLGGTLPRRIHYFPTTGKVKMLLLRRKSDKDLFRRELEYTKEVKGDGGADDIELFE